MAWALGADLLDVSYTKATYGFNPKTKTSAFVMYNGAMMVNLNASATPTNPVRTRSWAT